MLIIPIQNKPDWSKPPLITIGLILVNLLVFLFYQGNDDDIAMQATAIYQNNNLLQVERDYYLDFLRTERSEDSIVLEQIDDDAVQNEMLVWSIFYDRQFDQHLAALWEQGAIPKNEETREWRTQRDNFEQQRNRLSSIAAGLTPAESRPWTFITSLFLHGGWDHLLGNMVFLFLFGFALETALRAHVYLAMYLLSGVAADILFIALNPDSYVPLVGASGAISGLMGMYLSLYRLRRIRFFYTVFFYFGEFRAPALFVLPVWLAKELYGHFFIDSNTAYWAHIGGLLAGAGLMLLAQGSQRQFAEVEQTREQEDDLVETLKKIQWAATQLDFKKARTLARWLCQRYPHDPRPWQTLFDLHKIQPGQKAFHETTFAVLKQFASEQTPFAEWEPPVQAMLEEYRNCSPKAPVLTGNLCLALARKFWHNGARHQCEKFLQLAQRKGANPQATIRLLQDMQGHYRQRRQSAKAERAAELIRQLQKINPSEASPGVE